MLVVRSIVCFGCLLALSPRVSSHSYISQISVDDGALQPCQKHDLVRSPCRDVSANTGWQGSRFLDQKGIICGSGGTPMQKMAAPEPPFFSDVDQSAGVTLTVSAGSTLTMIISMGDTGWPHRPGHSQAYLARCGDSPTACQGWDASTGSWFKIASEMNSMPKLISSFDKTIKGSPLKVVLPIGIASGSYMLRQELRVLSLPGLVPADTKNSIAIDQSSPIEGLQDQYYPFCIQLYLSGLGTDRPTGVTLPGAYVGFGLAEMALPGPPVSAPAPLRASSPTVTQAS